MRSSSPISLSQLSRMLEKPQSRVLAVPGEEDVARTVAELRSFLPAETLPILSLPGFVQAGVFKFESARRAICARIETLWSWSQASDLPQILVASELSLQRVCLSPKFLQQSALGLEAGEELDQDLLLEALAHRSYVKGPRVEEKGDLSVRGSIIDLWSPQHEHPLRIEFFGDSIESLRFFRVSDQRSLETVKSATILPVREFLWPQGSQKLEAAVDRFNHFSLNNHILGRTRSDLLENISHNVPFPGIDDAFVTFVTADQFEVPWEKWAVPFLKLGADEDFKSVRAETLRLYSSSSSSSRTAIAVPFSSVFPHWTEEALSKAQPFSVPDSSLTEKLQSQLQSLSTQKMTARAQGLMELLDSGEVQHLVFQTPHPDSLFEVTSLISKDFVFEPEKLPKLDPQVLTGSRKPFARISAVRGSGEELFWIPESSTLVLTESYLRGAHKQILNSESLDSTGPASEPTHWKGKQAAQRLLQAQFGEFSEGDLVVHVQHGIAKFVCLMTIKIMDITGDFLALQYAGGDKVYVPVQQFSLVQRYVGSSPENPDSILDSLKGTSWEKRRQKAKVDAEKVAREMMEHQAKRATTPGHSYSPLDEDYHQFCSAFPYDETDDQLTATADIMRDMSTPKAMDRLLVGDVGFGKTEVAFRAAYRAVLDGKQVAWLVPTTVLAHQHHRSALERYKDFGLRLEILDRTAGTKAQTKVLRSRIRSRPPSRRLCARARPGLFALPWAVDAAGLQGPWPAAWPAAAPIFR